jgi:tetratricopeptide (TPR) repeat protein
MHGIMGILEPFIRAYQTTLGPPWQPLLLLFTLLSFVYVWRGIKLANMMWRSWAQLAADPLTSIKKKIAEDASFYIFVPVGVFIHEMGHAIVVWFFGGKVVEFGYFFYWGYVLPNQAFNDWQAWLLSLAGTLGNVFFALAIYFWTRNNASHWVRFLGRRVVRFQIFFAFIYYPIFTALLAFGDWRTIYDFGATPVLSGITAVFHAGVLLLYFLLDRRGWFEEIGYESAEIQQRQVIILGRGATHPDDPAEQWGRIQVLLNGGAPKRAKWEAQQLVKRRPDSAEAHLLLAITEAGGHDRLPPKAAQGAIKALALGLTDPGQLMTAHRMAGMYYGEIGRTEDALREFDLALDAADSAERQGKIVEKSGIYYEQGIVLRRLGREQASRDAFDTAIRTASNAGNAALADRYRAQSANLSQQPRR